MKWTGEQFQCEFGNAIRLLIDVMDEGELTHKSGEWKETTIGEHLVHADKHLESMLELGDSDADHHLHHATMRLVMAVELHARRQQKQQVQKVAAYLSCPNCNTTLDQQRGCMACLACGYKTCE